MMPPHASSTRSSATPSRAVSVQGGKRPPTDPRSSSRNLSRLQTPAAKSQGSSFAVAAAPKGGPNMRPVSRAATSHSTHRPLSREAAIAASQRVTPDFTHSFKQVDHPTRSVLHYDRGRSVGHNLWRLPSPKPDHDFATSILLGGNHPQNPFRHMNREYLESLQRPGTEEQRQRERDEREFAAAFARQQNAGSKPPTPITTSMPPRPTSEMAQRPTTMQGSRAKTPGVDTTGGASRPGTRTQQSRPGTRQMLNSQGTTRATTSQSNARRSSSSLVVPDQEFSLHINGDYGTPFVGMSDFKDLDNGEFTSTQMQLFQVRRARAKARKVLIQKHYNRDFEAESDSDMTSDEEDRDATVCRQATSDIHDSFAASSVGRSVEEIIEEVDEKEQQLSTLPHSVFTPPKIIIMMFRFTNVRNLKATKALRKVGYAELHEQFNIVAKNSVITKAQYLGVLKNYLSPVELLDANRILNCFDKTALGDVDVNMFLIGLQILLECATVGDTMRYCFTLMDTNNKIPRYITRYEVQTLVGYSDLSNDGDGAEKEQVAMSRAISDVLLETWHYDYMGRMPLRDFLHILNEKMQALCPPQQDRRKSSEFMFGNVWQGAPIVAAVHRMSSKKMLYASLKPQVNPKDPYAIQPDDYETPAERDSPR